MLKFSLLSLHLSGNSNKDFDIFTSYVTLPHFILVCIYLSTSQPFAGIGPIIYMILVLERAYLRTGMILPERSVTDDKYNIPYQVTVCWIYTAIHVLPCLTE